MNVFFIYIIGAMLLLSCNKTAKHVHDDNAALGHSQASNHSHAAPFGGLLKELKGHKASLECLIEQDALMLYIHDGCAEKNIRIPQHKIDTVVVLGDGSEKLLSFSAIASELSGDTVGNASSFQNQQDGVKFGEVQKITVKEIEIQGILYRDIEFKVK